MTDTSTPPGMPAGVIAWARPYGADEGYCIAGPQLALASQGPAERFLAAGWSPLVAAAQAANPPAAQPLTDEEINDAQGAAYFALRAEGFRGGMGGDTWDRASARAIERAVWAKLGIAPSAQGEQTP